MQVNLYYLASLGSTALLDANIAATTKLLKYNPVTPIPLRMDMHSNVQQSELAISQFNPAGQLVAQAHEHMSCITELSVHPNMSWFASASTDCTVKIWDSRNVDRDPILNSSSSYSLESMGKLLGLTILVNSGGTISFCTQKGWIGMLSAQSGKILHSIRIYENGGNSDALFYLK